MFKHKAEALSPRTLRSSGAAARAFAIVLCLGTAVTGAPAQSTTPSPGPAAARLLQEQKTMAAEERQKKMAADADRLVLLAQQLKASVDKTNKDTLSVEVLRNAEKVEKLAHELRAGVVK